MAARNVPLIPLIAFLVVIAAPVRAQVGCPSVPGGNALGRLDTPSSHGTPLVQHFEQFVRSLWSRPLRLPGGPPVVASTVSGAWRPERQTWLRSRQL